DLLMNVGKLAESTGKVHDSCYFASQRVSSQCAVEGREVVRSGVMKGYANPHLVVSPRELAPMLGGVGAIPLLVLDLRPPEAYASGHIPGAIHLDLWGVSLIDTDPAPLKAFMWMIEHVLAVHGVDRATPIVVYEQQSGARAARTL